MRQSTIFTLLGSFFLAVLVARVDADSFNGKAKLDPPYKGSCGFTADNMVSISTQSGHQCGDSITITAGNKKATGVIAHLCTPCGLNEIGVVLGLFLNLGGSKTNQAPLNASWD